MMIRIFSFFCSMLFAVVAVAQNLHIQEKGYTLWVGVGMLSSHYQGDFTYGETDFVRVSPGLCVSTQFEGVSNLQGQLSFGFGRFTEQNDKIRFLTVGEFEPNNFVDTRFQYLDLMLRYRMFKKYRFQPYVSAGAGIFTFNAKDENGYSLVSNIYSRLYQNNYNTVIPSVPLSVGFRVQCAKHLQIELGYTYRIVATDYLDNIADAQTGVKNGNDKLQGLSLSVCLGFQTKLKSTISKPPAPNPSIPTPTTRDVEPSFSKESTSPPLLINILRW
ncbi:MAG: outer membrane beta-barrel protein [Bacteroidia bacterium]